jgi:hypothetical protein
MNKNKIIYFTLFVWNFSVALSAATFTDGAMDEDVPEALTTTAAITTPAEVSTLEITRENSYQRLPNDRRYTKFDISDNNFRNDRLIGFSFLKTLFLRDCRYVGGRFFGLENLEHLMLGTKDKDNGVSLARRDFLNPEDLKILPKLETLEMWGVKGSQESLNNLYRCIGECLTLKRVAISAPFALNAENIAALSGLPSLESLELCDSNYRKGMIPHGNRPGFQNDDFSTLDFTVLIGRVKHLGIYYPYPQIRINPELFGSATLESIGLSKISIGDLHIINRISNIKSLRVNLVFVPEQMEMDEIKEILRNSKISRDSKFNIFFHNDVNRFNDFAPKVKAKGKPPVLDTKRIKRLMLAARTEPVDSNPAGTEPVNSDPVEIDTSNDGCFSKNKVRAFELAIKEEFPNSSALSLEVWSNVVYREPLS